MVTHLTAQLHTGEDTLKDFMSRCAMDIDFNKRSREITFTGELPIYSPDTRYSESRLENAKHNLASIKTKTDVELDAYLLEQFEVSKKMYDDTKAEKAALLVKYQTMLDKVNAWTPPTEQHEFLKDYAIKTLERGIDYDCTVHLPEPQLQGTEDYRNMCIEMYEQDIIRAQESIEKELISCNRSNEWNKQLIDSIHAIMKQTEV